MEKDKTQHISFRLQPKNFSKLKEQAHPFGLSPGEYARSLVLDALCYKEELNLKDDIQSLQSKLQSLRQALANGVQALMALSEKMPKEEVESWVNRYVR